MIDFERLESLSPAKQRAVVALLSESTVEGAAKTAGVSAVTLRRWRSDPAFREVYRLARETMWEEATARLAVVARSAVETLHREMTNPDARPGERIRAAQVLLEASARCATREPGAEEAGQSAADEDFERRLEAIYGERAIEP